MLALIDADTPVFAAAISCLDKELWVATSRLDMSIHKIIEGSGCTEHKLYVSGGVNFRYAIDANYKKNRGADPPHREACRQHLITKWGAIETDGYEADDAVGCEQNPDGSTVICGIDKDLLMIPGKHYQWPIMRKGKVIREARTHFTTHDDGMKMFFTQSLTGDVNDNIGTYLDPTSKTWKKCKHLLGPKAAEKLLINCKSEEEMYNVCREIHPTKEAYHTSLDLLWIWRSYGMTYSLRREEQGL